VHHLSIPNICFAFSAISSKFEPKREMHPFTVDEKTLEFLRKYLEQKKIKSGRIFPYTRQWVFNLVRKIKKAGITQVGEKKLHPHHLRHSFAIFCIKRGMDLRKLQMILGHASISTTAHYLQFSPVELEQEYEKIWKGVE